MSVVTSWGTFSVPDDHIGRTMRSSHYEGAYIDLILKACKKRRIAIDVGANIGTHTIPYGKSFERVEAFEPLPCARDILEENINQNHLGNVAVHEVALGRMSSSATITADPDNWGHAVVCPTAFGGQVKIRTLDSFGFRDVDLIKIDVEGMEDAVLAGADKTIARDRPVIAFEKVDCGEAFGLLLVRHGYKQIQKVSKNYIALP